MRRPEKHLRSQATKNSESVGRLLRMPRLDQPSCLLVPPVNYLCTKNPANLSPYTLTTTSPSSNPNNHHLNHPSTFVLWATQEIEFLFKLSPRRKLQVKDSYPVATYLFSQDSKRNDRKIDARKDTWEGGRKSTTRFSSFLSLMRREFTKSFPLITARIQRSNWVLTC